MRSEGQLLYDSDQYLDDINRWVRDHDITWRDKKDKVWDSPNLYFAVLPNGDFAPCCDHRLENRYQTFSDDFINVYKSKTWREEVKEVTKKCEGCMYGSYPEITISMRFMSAKIQRFKTFISSPPEKKWPIEYEELIDIANKIAKQ